MSRYSRTSECPSPDYSFKTADRSLSWGKIKSKHRRSSSGSPSFKAPTPRKREFKSPKTTEFKTNSFNLESPSWKSKVSHKSSSKSPHREDSSDGRGASTSSKSAHRLGRKAPTYSSDSETEKYLKSSKISSKIAISIFSHLEVTCQLGRTDKWIDGQTRPLLRCRI